MGRLSPALIDQIAAGEVVERPASVVKELVENAVDADASRIRVEVREGGAALVAVTDDGFGMTVEDARLALERHATSKLRSLEDLDGIRSFGFRGEALPAIASVSSLRLRTCARGASEGVELFIEHGKLLGDRSVGGPEGTRVEVAELFAGIPARRKFLKTAATEWGHIADWLARAALSLPEVHFDVQRDDRPAIHWPAARDPLDRIAAVLSDREAEALVPAEHSQGALRVRGFVSRPDAHRRNATGLYLFVNGRPVRDRLLRHAILQAYRDWLPRGRYPTALLDLSVPTDRVDVNVHPAKWEVRFADPQEVHRVVTAAIRDAIVQRSWLAPTEVPSPPGDTLVRERPYRPTEGAVAAPTTSDWVLADAATEAPRSPQEAAPRLRFGALRCIGQLLATYLLVEDTEGLLLVDQHAAHERILYERLRAGFLEGGVERQALLMPATVELPAAAVAAVGSEAEALLQLGFEVEAFGDETVVVRALPALLSGQDPDALVRGLADELVAEASAGSAARETGAGRLRQLEAADRIFASIACHAARRAGDALDAREQKALLEGLDTIPWAPTCPHGRPVAVPLPRGEIERRFGR